MASAVIHRTASCSCGSLSVETHGNPVRVSICHCLECQKRTGSVFAVQARFPVEATRVDGNSRERSRTGDEGSTARFHFCPACGSTVYYVVDNMPAMVMIPVGAFADPDFPPPQVSVYEARQHGWVRLADGIEHFD